MGKIFPIVFIVGVAQAGLVLREAEAEPKADAGVYASSSQPICKSVPEKTCTPRNVEKPREVCHDEYDKIVDTTITEHCEEIITTKCEQVSTTSRLAPVLLVMNQMLLLLVSLLPQRELYLMDVFPLVSELLMESVKLRLKLNPKLMLIVPTMVILVPIPSLLPSVPVFLKRCARKCLLTHQERSRKLFARL